MHTTNTQPCRRAPGQVLATAMALLLLAVLAVPADAQRGGGQRGGGRGGSGHQGHYGGHSGHRGGGQSYGSHRRGGSRGAYGYGHRGRGHSGYRGHSNRGHGYRGHSGYYSNRGHHGYRDHRGYGRHSSYRGYYRYPSYYGGYSPYNSYIYYRSPGYYGSWAPLWGNGFGYRGYPVSIYYDTSPSYVVGGRTYAEPSYQSSIAIPEGAVTESGEPYPAVEPAGSPEPYDARPQPARVTLSIEPGDASVYLDGRFLGLASELPQELWIDPGSHRLEVVRPGFTGQALDLELEAGEELDVDAHLNR